jgi:hypothetical protein
MIQNGKGKNGIPYWNWSMTGLLFPSPPMLCATISYLPSSALSTDEIVSIAFLLVCHGLNLFPSDKLSVSPSFSHRTDESGKLDSISARNVTIRIRFVMSDAKWTTGGSVKIVITIIAWAFRFVSQTFPHFEVVTTYNTCILIFLVD